MAAHAARRLGRRLYAPLTVAALAGGGCALTGPLVPDAPLAISASKLSERVLVIRQSEYVVAAEGMALEIGDRVANMGNEETVLRYVSLDAQGDETDAICEIPIPADSQLTVAGISDCGSPDVVANSIAGPETADSARPLPTPQQPPVASEEYQNEVIPGDDS